MRTRNKRSSKFVALLMAFMMVFTMIPASAFAGTADAEPATSWAELADVSWYNTSDTSFEIDTAAKLAGLAAITNNMAKDAEGNAIARDNFTGKTIKLTADIDLGGKQAEDGSWSGTTWVPIGMNTDTMKNPDDMAFEGTFDGQGHEISNLYINGTDTYRGLFSCVGENSKVLHLNLETGYVCGNSISGGIAGYNKGSIVDCHNGADVTAGGAAQGLGGIAGYTAITSVIYRCSNSGNITGTWSLGGIVGVYNGAAKDVYNTGNIDISARTQVDANHMAGGLIGDTGQRGASTLTNAYSSGEMIYGDSVDYVGGVAGESTKMTFTNCYYLKDEGINESIYAVGGASVETDTEGTAAKEKSGLQGLAETLGDSFVSGSDDSYPVLEWESTGSYAADESTDFAVESVELTNGKITLMMNKVLEYTKLALDDFTVNGTQKVGEEEAKDYAITPTAISTTQNDEGTKNVVVLAFAEIDGTYDDAVYTVEVSFGSGSAVTSNELAVEGSGRWMDYAASDFAGGDGTATAPYQIATAEQLALLSKRVNNGDSLSGKYFKLTADIDLSKAAINDKELEWTPIGGGVYGSKKKLCWKL